MKEIHKIIIKKKNQIIIEEGAKAAIAPLIPTPSARDLSNPMLRSPKKMFFFFLLKKKMLNRQQV